MLTPKASKNTPLKNAPSTWARFQPKVNVSGEDFRSDNYKEGGGWGQPITTVLKRLM